MTCRSLRILGCFATFSLLFAWTAGPAAAQSGTRNRKYAPRRAVPKLPSRSAPAQKPSSALGVDQSSPDQAEPVVMTVSTEVPEKASETPKIDAQVIARLLPQHPTLALGGNDPVVLVETGNLVLGQPTVTARFDGQTYQFSTDETKGRFQADPGNFAPVLAGDSTVAWVDRKELPPGNLQHLTVYGGKIYLFASDEEKKKFDAEPKAYFEADLLLQGFSPVSLVIDETLRRGSKEFEVELDGWRMYLASAEEVEHFKTDPGKYFPNLAGIDPVTAAEGAPTLGLARFAVVYKNRLYATSSSENRQKFIANPAPYSDFDVAEEGTDPVILGDERQKQAGHYGISTVYRGRRYLFANEENRKKFLEDPSKYVRDSAN